MAYKREDVTDAQLQKGRETAKQRNGFVVYHDKLETWDKLLTPEQGWRLIKALDDYTQTLEKESFDDPAFMMAYAMATDDINRDVEKYATTCANHAAAALEREAKKRKQTKESHDVPEGKPPNEKSPPKGFHWTDDMIFTAALKTDTAKGVLQGYAMQQGLWIPPDIVCRYMGQSQYQKPFLNHPLQEVHDFLQKHLQGEDCEEVIDNIFERIRKQSGKAQL